MTDEGRPPFTPGTLVAYADYSGEFIGDEPRLALTADDPRIDGGNWWYGLHFVQFPERGYMTGGSMWSRKASDLRVPTSPAEVLAANRYWAAARVIAARAELKTAETEQGAIELAVAMIERERVARQ